MRDFNCTYNNILEISKVSSRRSELKFPEAYMYSEGLVQLSTALKELEKTPFCFLPLCHTVEGEAFGADINYGNGDFGPRARTQICSSLQDILTLPDIDFTQGRIAEVLEACRILAANNQYTVLEISGPFTILDTLIDSVSIFKAMRREPDSVARVMDKLRKNISAYFEEAIRAGVNIISYADSAGGLNILGPKLSEQMVRSFTYPLLKEVEKKSDCRALTVLCPKTAYALIGTGVGEWHDVQLDAPMGFGQACIESIGKIKLVGQMCIKNPEFRLEQGIIKEIKIL